jgi:mevalonate kinase
MKNFNSKILLFGEYALLYGSNALAMPLDLYSGKLDFTENNNREALDSNKLLLDFLHFLQKNRNKFSYINMDGFEYDLKDGLFFNSTIPQNYGLGSSGALVASIFDRYHFLGQGSDKNLPGLRAMLANLESWFHGKSSGIDPLVSYLDKPVVIRNNIPEVVSCSPVLDDDFRIFLIDTGQESSTGFQTRSFQQLLKNKMFYYLFLENYVPYINSTISFFLEKNYFNFGSILANVVDFQYKHFKILFPSFTRELIKEGLEENAFYLKLCGSGGGGFLLGFTQDLDNTKQILSNKNVSLMEVNLG